MCFSTSASFGAGIVLAVIGIATIKKAENKNELFFASIPLIFSIQQITEGFIWISLLHPKYNYLEPIFSFIFIFIAQVIWPFWVPFSIFKIEKKVKLKKYLKILVGIGLFLSLVLGYFLFVYPIQAKISGFHISYIQRYPIALGKLGFGVLYVIATIGPHFISSVNKMWFLGTSILISYLITAIFYSDYVLSVWCFFASLISFILFFIVKGMKNSL